MDGDFTPLATLSKPKRHKQLRFKLQRPPIYHRIVAPLLQRRSANSNSAPGRFGSYVPRKRGHESL